MSYLTCSATQRRRLIGFSARNDVGRSLMASTWKIARIRQHRVALGMRVCSAGVDHFAERALHEVVNDCASPDDTAMALDRYRCPIQPLAPRNRSAWSDVSFRRRTSLESSEQLRRHLPAR